MPTGSKNMEAAWQSHEGTIRDLYFAKNMTLVEVMAHMKQNYGFDASKGQYESRFRKWNLRKHLKGSEWKYVSRRVQKRKKEGKESAVYFNRVAIAAEKVRKETSRHDVPTYRSASTPETPNDVSVCTPASAATPPAPGPYASPAVPRYTPTVSSNALVIDQTSSSFRDYFKYLATSDLNLRVTSDSPGEHTLYLMYPKNHRDFLLSCSFTLLETRDGYLRVGVGFPSGAVSQGRVLGLKELLELPLAAEGTGVDKVVILTRKALVLATTNLREVIIPFVQLVIAAYHGNKQGRLRDLVLEAYRQSLFSAWLRDPDLVAERSHEVTIGMLVAAGTPMDASDDNGDTALHCATRREDESMVVFLLDHGHEVDVKNTLGKTP